MRILLIEPEFPIPNKSRNHKDFLPIGLIKLDSYFRSLGNETRLIRGNKHKSEIGREFNPKEIFVTSLFTYWSESVWNSIDFYRQEYPKAKIILGGIYASLMNADKEFKTKLNRYNVEVFVGTHNEAESYASKFPLDYSIVNNHNPIDYQIIHSSRGCIRRCKFCGTWIIEPTFESKKTIKQEVIMEKLVFYDNNLLANPNIEKILDELIDLKKERKILWCESQSGFDGRILSRKPTLALKLKEAGFKYPKIAWDGSITDSDKIKNQIKILKKAGFSSKNIMIFMIYNCDMSFEEMERKRIACWNWKIQISDCRYRPLDQKYDHYNPRKQGQTNEEYHIHKEAQWTDELVKQFRRNVRRQNICVRHGFPFHSSRFETKSVSKIIIRRAKILKNRKEMMAYLTEHGIDYWFPGRISYPEENQYQKD